jgi:hypothetical protein
MSMAHGSTDPSLNDGRWWIDMQSRFNMVKRYFLDLILDVDLRIYAGDLIRPNRYA